MLASEKQAAEVQSFWGCLAACDPHLRLLVMHLLIQP
jgi:hypothetical protein